MRTNYEAPHYVGLFSPTSYFSLSLMSTYSRPRDNRSEKCVSQNIIITEYRISYVPNIECHLRCAKYFKPLKPKLV
jgi:hypothetical protein